MEKIKFRPGCLVSDAISYMTNKELIGGDYLNKKRCIHLATNDEGDVDLRVHKNSEGLLECDMCNRKIYDRFDQSAIDIIDRCKHAILSREQLALGFANLLDSSVELVTRNRYYGKYIDTQYLPINIDKFYQARFVIEHRFDETCSLLKQLIMFVVDYEKNPDNYEQPINYETLKPLYPPINDETENPEDIIPISGNDVTLIDECISVIDQLLIFGMLNGLRAHVQDHLMMLRTALHDLVERLQISDDMDK